MAGDKNINIGVGADVSGLKTGMNDAAKLVQDAGTKMQTAAKDATTKTEQSFSNLRQAYRATARDAYEIALSQGTNSAAFLEATEKAGKFKDELDLVNTKIKAFSSDTPVLTSALGVGQGLAGAFAAAQGAMALFGGESDKLQEAMVKVQASMALVQGLTALGGLKDSFMALSAVITTRVVPAIASIGVTLSASGIGIAVLAIGALVMVYKQLSDESNKVAEKTRLAEKAQRDYNASVYDYLATDRQKEIREENMRFLALKKLAEDRKKLLDDEATDLNKAKFGDALKKRNDDYKKVLSDIENIEKQHQDNIKEIRKKYEPKITKSQDKPEAKINETKVDTKSNFGNLKNVIKFNPVVEFDPTVIDDISDLILDSSEQIAESLDGMTSPIDQNLTNMKLKLAEFKDQVEVILIEGLGNAFAEFGRIAGANLAGANESVGAAAEAMIGSLAATIGSGMIALGVPMLFAVATAGEGAALIAGGVALNVLAGALGESSKGGGGSRSQPSRDNNYSPNNSFSGFTPVANDYSMTSRLIGTDLLLSVEKSAKKMERVR